MLAATSAPAGGRAASYAAMITAAGLRGIARYAWGIGPGKVMLGDGQLVRDAHATGLCIHPWAFRAENHSLAPPFRRGVAAGAHGDLHSEIVAALGLGIDGFFTDYLAMGVKARGVIK